MNDQVKETKEKNELIISIPKENALQVFIKPDGLKPILDKIRNEVRKFVPDITTEKGRKEIASMARRVASSKVHLDNLGKELVSDWKAKAKVVDQSRRKVRDELDALKDEVRRPLAEYEAKEASRIQKFKNDIEMIMEYKENITTNGITAMTIEQLMIFIDTIKSTLNTVDNIAIDESWEEFEMKASSVKSEVLSHLKLTLECTSNYLKEKQESEELRKREDERKRKEHEERLKKEAAENAKREAENKVKQEKEKLEREKIEAEQKEKDAKQRADKLERENKELEERIKQDKEKARKKRHEVEQKAVEDERKRQEEKKRKEEAEKKKREEDQANRKKVLGQIGRDLIKVSGISKEQATSIINALVRNEISHVNVRF